MSEHDAGRALDALVAEKVMGWRTPRGHIAGPWTLQPPDEDEAVTRVIPHYSTDIDAAWLVVGRLTTRKFYVCVEYVHKPRSAWNAWIGGHNASATTPALAICRAALAALNDQPEDVT